MIPKFLRYARETREQLTTARGLLGFSFRAQFLRRRLCTLWAWEDEASLLAFVRTEPHSRIVADLAPYLGRTKFVRWRIDGTAIPPTWDEGLRRFATVQSDH